MFGVNFRARLRVAVVLLMLSIGLASPFSTITFSQQTARSQRVFPPAQYIPDHDFDTKNISLDLRFDWEKEQLLGRETLTFSPLVSNLNSISLDAANMTATTIKTSSGSALKFSSDPANEKLNISLDRAYQTSDEITLVIEYHTNGPQDRRRAGLVGVGLAFIKPNADDPTRPKQLWSQGESEYNRYWFPSYDHPNDFFTTEITATVEKPLQVISNGKLIETKENKDGTRTFHWKMDQPHAGYLTSIIVGEYTAIAGEYQGIPVITYVYPKEAEEGRLTAVRLPEMVKFFSEKTGIKYPYAKYAQTMARDFGGGMENISATTQTDNMIHDKRTELDQTSDGLQSHELAHQWFGDYVTARTWADIWLNESFATYFQAMWDEYKLGQDDFLYSDIKANQDSYFTAWKLGNRRPIVTKNYNEPDSVFDTYAYPRGGAVLHMLRKSLGEDNWWRAINYYLKKYAHQPVETEQFRIAIEESTGQSMDWFFDEWLYRMGHPIFKVTQQYDDATKSLTLTVDQQQKVDADSQYPQVALFQMPVEIEIGTAGSTRIEQVRIEPKQQQTFTFKVDSKPLLVNFDYKGTLIKEIDFKKSAEELSYQVEHDQDVLGRIWAVNQLSALAKVQTTSNDQKELIASTISKAAGSDKFWGMRVEAATALASVPGQTARTALLAATKDTNAKVRARAVISLSSSADPTLASVYQGLLNDPSYAVIRASAFALGQTKNPVAYDSLSKLLTVSSWRDSIRASALAGLAALGDSRAVEAALRYAGRGNPSQVRVASIRILGTLGKTESRSYDVVAQTLEGAYGNSDSALVVASAESLAKLADPRGLTVLDRLTRVVNVPQQQSNAILRSQELLKKGVAGAENPTAARP